MEWDVSKLLAVHDRLKYKQERAKHPRRWH